MITPADHPEHVVELLDHAFNRGDVEAVLAFYEEAATVVATPPNILRGKTQLRSFFKTALLSGSRAKQLKVRVIETDGIALFLSHWSLVPKDAAPEAAGQVFFATTVFRKQSNGSWKVLIDNPFGSAALESAERPPVHPQT
ncbi:MAG TPA: nuclear transport factor 2 family protein [Terracidiphilus sp.]|nr:nuclear transport factor 2 family protein [Terracidiphilus sp.]